MPASVIVFLDYQNVYNCAREEFGLLGNPTRFGTVDPLRFAERIVARHPDDTKLVGVRVYRGLPDSGRQPEAYGASLRQREAHLRAGRGLVVFRQRVLRYPADWPASKPEEKGVDVELAVDFVTMAANGAYDIGVIASVDTDLVPALEAVANMPGPYPRCEVAAWHSAGRHSRRLHVKGRKMWCHWMDETDFDAVRDDTDYNLPVR